MQTLTGQNISGSLLVISVPLPLSICSIADFFHEHAAEQPSGRRSGEEIVRRPYPCRHDEKCQQGLRRDDIGHQSRIAAQLPGEDVSGGGGGQAGEQQEYPLALGLQGELLEE